MQFNLFVLLDLQSHSQPLNAEISIVNGTVVVKGDVLMRKSKNDKVDQSNESNESIASCEVLFLEAEDDNLSQQSSENISRDASGKKSQRKQKCMIIFNSTDPPNMWYVKNSEN